MTLTLQEQNKKPRISRITRIKEVLHEELTGLDEKLYERALVIELHRRGHTVPAQRSYPVFYRSELIGHLLPDLIVDDAVIVDPRVVSAFDDTPVAQMIGYLAISKVDLALLLNFKSARLEWKRVVRQDGRESNPPDLHA
jgi:GxxExxY protein